MIRARRCSLAAAFAAVVVSWVFPAPAQTAFEDSVANRARPDYDPIGMVVGPADSFLFYPKLELATEHTDNLFSEKDKRVSDQAAIFKPSFSLKSDWVNHAVGLSGNITETQYLNNPDEDSFDYEIAANGRLDILERSRVSADFKLTRGHEDRGSVDDTAQKRPTVIHTGKLNISGVYNVDVILLRLDVDTTRTDIRDSGAVNNDDRDLLEIKIKSRAGYEWVPGSTAFVEAAYDNRDFDDRIDDNGFNRSSHGYEVLLGNTLDLSGVTFAELGVGYRKQIFDKQLGNGVNVFPTLDPVEGFSFSGRLVWNPTDLLTITGRLRREIRETTVFEDLPGGGRRAASSAFSSTFDLKADYEMLDNLIFNADASFERESFEGLDRVDNVFKFGAGARYLIGPNFFVTAKYQYQKRDSDLASDSFFVNKFTVSVGAQF